MKLNVTKSIRRNNIVRRSANKSLSTNNNENNILSEEKVMDTKEKIELANSLLEAEAPVKAKRIKKDKGLLERTEGSTIVLTEDNKELLKD